MHLLPQIRAPSASLHPGHLQLLREAWMSCYITTLPQKTARSNASESLQAAKNHSLRRPMTLCPHPRFKVPRHLSPYALSCSVLPFISRHLPTLLFHVHFTLRRTFQLQPLTDLVARLLAVTLLQGHFFPVAASAGLILLHLPRLRTGWWITVLLTGDNDF